MGGTRTPTKEGFQAKVPDDSFGRPILRLLGSIGSSNVIGTSMNEGSSEIPNAAAATDRLRLQLEECRRELDACRKRIVDLEQGESALRASEARFRQMADAIPEVIWFTALDPEEVLYVSPSFERIWGLRVEELYKNPRLWMQMIHPDDRERVNNIFLGWITGVELNYQGLEYRIVQPGGAVRWIHELGVVTRAENGKPLRVSGISTDITERKQVEENLRRSQAYLAEAQRLSRTGSFGWCAAKGVVVWSDETFCILGYDRSVKPALELVFNRVHPDDLARVRQTVYDAARDGTGFDFEHRFLMPDGAVKHVHVVARAGSDGSGGVEFVGAVMDNTDSITAQEATRAAKARFEGILEIAEDAIICVNSQQRIVLFNQGAEKAFGYSQHEVIGQPLDSLLPGRFAAAHRGHIESFGKSPEVSRLMGQRRELFARRKDGSEFPAEASISKLALGGELTFTVILRDITEQKRLENRLRQSENNLAEGQRLTKTGSWILDYHTGNTDWSVETCRIFGFPDPPPSPHYSEFRARVRPEDREAVDRGLRESFETGEPRPLEYIFVLPNGVKKNIETISQPVKGETGTVLRLIGTVMDVTERKQAAEALCASDLLARGQLDALKKTLDRLSQESEPEKFLQHVLRTIAEQLEAHSIGVWEMNKPAGSTAFVANYENDRLQVASEAADSPPTHSLWEREHPVWAQFFLDGRYCVVGKLGTERPKVRIENGEDDAWHDWQPDAASYPRLSAMIKHLSDSGIITTLCVPLFVAGKVSGLISIRFRQRRAFRREEIELTRALSHQAMLAIQLMRLSQQSRQTAVIAERNRMARDIHDTLAQGFTGVIMQLEAAKGATKQGDVVEAETRIERASELARSSLGEARRSVRALRPRSLRNGKLFMTLDNMLRRMTEGTCMNAEFRSEGDERAIPAEYEDGLLRITQESLTNAVKHANARNFKATLNVKAKTIQLQLVDDGRGFDPHTEHEGFGLVGIKERVEQMNGEFILRAKPGVGTEILVILKNQSASNPETLNDQG